MIRSKIDALKEARHKACNSFEGALATQRGNSEARVDAMMRRKQAKETGLCSCCGANPPVGESGMCSSCDAAVKRMLNFKSKLNSDWPKEKALKRFIDDYSHMPNPPYSLKGSAPREIILLYAEELLEATIALDAEIKKATMRAALVDAD